LNLAHKAIHCGIDAAMRVFLARPHQDAVVANVSTQDRGEPPPNAPAPGAGAKRERTFCWFRHHGIGRTPDNGHGSGWQRSSERSTCQSFVSLFKR
jgi:hypothetical protein